MLGGSRGMLSQEKFDIWAIWMGTVKKMKGPWGKTPHGPSWPEVGGGRGVSPTALVGYGQCYGCGLFWNWLLITQPVSPMDCKAKNSQNQGPVWKDRWWFSYKDVDHQAGRGDGEAAWPHVPRNRWLTTTHLIFECNFFDFILAFYYLTLSIKLAHTVGTSVLVS